MIDDFQEWRSKVMHYAWIAARNAKRPHNTEDFAAVLAKAGPMPRLYTRAEVLALMERVREACKEAWAINHIDWTVDVARLLDSDVDPEAAWTKGNIP